MTILLLERFLKEDLSMYTPVTNESSAVDKYWSRYSPKLHRHIVFNSLMEYRNWLVVECNPYVKCFKEYPLDVQIPCGDHSVTITFDMWVQYLGGEEKLIQLQYEDDFLRSTSLSFHGLNVAEEWCKENEYTYSLVSNEGIYANEVYLENLEKIITAVELLQKHFGLALQHELLQILTVGEYTIKELCKTTNKNRVEVYRMICWLLYTGICTTNLLGASLDDHSIIKYTLSGYN